MKTVFRPDTQPSCFSFHIHLYSVLSFVLTVAMVSLLLGQLPGVLHPQPANQRDPEHAEETLPGFRQSRGLQSHHLQRVSVLIWISLIWSEEIVDGNFSEDRVNLFFGVFFFHSLCAWFYN